MFTYDNAPKILTITEELDTILSYFSTQYTEQLEQHFKELYRVFDKSRVEMWIENAKNFRLIKLSIQGANAAGNLASGNDAGELLGASVGIVAYLLYRRSVNRKEDLLKSAEACMDILQKLFKDSTLTNIMCYFSRDKQIKHAKKGLKKFVKESLDFIVPRFLPFFSELSRSEHKKHKGSDISTLAHFFADAAFIMLADSGLPESTVLKERIEKELIPSKGDDLFDAEGKFLKYFKKRTLEHGKPTKTQQAKRQTKKLLKAKGNDLGAWSIQGLIHESPMCLSTSGELYLNSDSRAEKYPMQLCHMGSYAEEKQYAKNKGYDTGYPQDGGTPSSSQTTMKDAISKILQEADISDEDIANSKTITTTLVETRRSELLTKSPSHFTLLSNSRKTRAALFKDHTNTDKLTAYLDDLLLYYTYLYIVNNHIPSLIDCLYVTNELSWLIKLSSSSQNGSSDLASLSTLKNHCFKLAGKYFLSAFSKRLSVTENEIDIALINLTPKLNELFSLTQKFQGELSTKRRDHRGNIIIGGLIDFSSLNIKGFLNSKNLTKCIEKIDFCDTQIHRLEEYKKAFDEIFAYLIDETKPIKTFNQNHQLLLKSYFEYCAQKNDGETSLQKLQAQDLTAPQAGNDYSLRLHELYRRLNIEGSSVCSQVTAQAWWQELQKCFLPAPNPPDYTRLVIKILNPEGQAGFFYLQKEIVGQIVSGGTFKTPPKTKTSDQRHRVIPFSYSEQRFWLKLTPETPWMEALINHLESFWGGQTALVTPISIQLPGKTIPVCACVTPHIDGTPLSSATANKLLGINLASFVRSLLRVLITNPEDDKPQDYRVDKKGNLWRIDNERILHPENKKRLFTNILQVKSAILCLPQMMSDLTKEGAAKSVLEAFMS